MRLQGPRVFPLSDRAFRGFFVTAINVPSAEVSVLMNWELPRGARLCLLGAGGLSSSRDGRFDPGGVGSVIPCELSVD
jgi:hypothetical protein